MAAWSTCSLKSPVDDAAAPANGVRKAVYRDPDGNDIGFGGVPR
jgi:hypothetical protein